MTDGTPMNVDRLPTLTEVLELGCDSAAASPPLAVLGGGGAADTDAELRSVISTDLVAQVLAALEPRVGALLETRLREALAPALARAADGLIRDVRAELAPTLRSLVEEAVAQALRQPR